MAIHPRRVDRHRACEHALAQLYGEHASLTIAPASPHGVQVTIKIPYRAEARVAFEGSQPYALHMPDR